MSIPTVVTTTVPSIVNTTTSITSAIPSVTSAIPSMTNAATSVANAVPSMVNAGSSIASAVNSLPPLPSMNSVSNTASNIVSTGSDIANSAMEKGKEAMSLIDKLMRDLGNLFTLKGLHNLSYFLLNIFVILTLIHLITKREDNVPKLHLYGLYVCGFCFIIFYILSYIFEDDKKNHDKKEDDKSALSTQPIVVK
jgi:hypothetical protein